MVGLVHGISTIEGHLSQILYIRTHTHTHTRTHTHTHTHIYIYIYIYIYMILFRGVYGISSCIGHLIFLILHTLNMFDWFGLAWFGLILRHINYCSLFNAKSFLYIYIICMINISKRAWSHFFRVKWFPLFLLNTNTQLNVKTILIQTIQFSISSQFLVYTQLVICFKFFWGVTPSWL